MIDFLIGDWFLWLLLDFFIGSWFLWFVIFCVISCWFSLIYFVISIYFCDLWLTFVNCDFSLIANRFLLFLTDFLISDWWLWLVIFFDWWFISLIGDYFFDWRSIILIDHQSNINQKPQNWSSIKKINYQSQKWINNQNIDHQPQNQSQIKKSNNNHRNQSQTTKSIINHKNHSLSTKINNQ